MKNFNHRRKLEFCLKHHILYKDMWSWSMATRFVNEHRLPIPVINKKTFFYFLKNYDSYFGTISKWNDLCTQIEVFFGGDPQAFVEGFIEIRNKVIEAVKENEAYQRFNTMDMSKFSVDKSKYKQKGKNVFCEANIGKTLVSIDLRKANFQALNYVDKDIMFNSATYDDFISKFTELPLVKKSKYFRQVFFGQLNPSRVFTVETYMVYQVIDLMTKHFEGLDYEIVSINADEVTISLNLNYYYDISSTVNKIYSFDSLCSLETGIITHTSVYTLDGYNFYSNPRNRKRFTFYVKNYIDVRTSKILETQLMCVPGPYFAITWKLFNHKKPSKMDYHFSYEENDCIFNDTFRIEKIK